jgi:magnesium chelatase subunit D
VTALPFSAVVGQDDAKTALVLAAIEPRLGGVLLRGHKGSAKTTLARGLAHLLPGDAPFVELPLGATEDRVLGSLDLGKLLAEGDARFRPGLLAAADGGVLYVDEINLLADHLVDALLDVAVSGVNRVEREGVSHAHPARFVLVASMNPEEGELRPQLLDRFGLAVDIETSTDPDERVAAVRRQLDADGDAGSVARYRAEDDALRDRLRVTRTAPVPDDVLAVASRVAVAVGAEGLRADLMLCRAAAAHAAWEGRGAATEGDVRRVAPFVLAHRRRRTPFDEPGITSDELDDAFDPPPPDGGAGVREEVIAPDARGTAPPRPTGARPARAAGTGAPTAAPTGRFVRDVPATEASTSFAVTASAVAVATRRAVDPDAALAVDDLRAAVRQDRAGNLVVLVVDASGSMGAQRRIAAAKSVAIELLADAYRRRDRVALVTFRGDAAEVVLRPTGSIEVARARLADLPVGGATPLAPALDAALDLAEGARREGRLEPLIVVVTDGRATSGADDPVAAAHGAADRIATAAVPALVVDAEAGVARLGLAAELARRLGARCVPLDELTPGQLGLG